MFAASYAGRLSTGSRQACVACHRARQRPDVDDSVGDVRDLGYGLGSGGPGGAATAHAGWSRSSSDLVARTPPAYFASTTLASLRQPASTHLLCSGTVGTDPTGEGTETGARSSSLPFVGVPLWSRHAHVHARSVRCGRRRRGDGWR